MTQEQHDYEMGCAGQAQAEYEAQMAYYEYLDSLIEFISHESIQHLKEILPNFPDQE